jgi:hypothetical protein
MKRCAEGRSPFAGILRACPEPVERVPLRYESELLSLGELRTGSGQEGARSRSEELFSSLLSTRRSNIDDWRPRTHGGLPESPP